LARSHQRIGTAILNHISCIHPQNTVSCILLIHFKETYSFMHQYHASFLRSKQITNTF
jgi:hypothetical protein